MEVIFIATKNITLFIDIEWSQPTNVFEIEKSQILQIAGIGVEQDGTEYKRFAHSVRPTEPDKVSPLALELIGAQLESLTRTTTKDVVLNNFFTTFSDVDTFVVWNKNAYDLLMYDAYKLGIKLKKHRLIVVQDLVKAISKVRYVAFENILDMLQIEHNKDLLHHAKYDVTYLKYACDTLNKIFAEAMLEADVTYCRTKSTGLIHGMYCGYISNLDNCQVLSGEDVIFGGKLCSCCVNRGKFRILKLKMPKTEKTQDAKTKIKPAELPKKGINQGKSKSQKKTAKKKATKENREIQSGIDRSSEYTDDNINRLMEKYAVDIRFGAGDMLYVDSGRTKWRIYYDREGVQRVYHENYKNYGYIRQDMNNTRYKKANAGFHMQNIKTKSLEGVLKYIKNHDENFVIKFKKNKIDLIFEQLEKEKRV